MVVHGVVVVDIAATVVVLGTAAAAAIAAAGSTDGDTVVVGTEVTLRAVIGSSLERRCSSHLSTMATAGAIME